MEENARAKNILYRFRPPTQKLEPVESLNATADTGRVTLNWSAAPGAHGYVVERSNADDADFAAIGSTNLAAFRDLTAAPGQSHQYRIRPVGWDGVGGASPIVKATNNKAGTHTTVIKAKTQELNDDIIAIETFEGGQSIVPKITPRPMPKPALPGGGEFVGELSRGNPLPFLNGKAIPEGAKAVVISYDRLYLQNPAGRCRSHYTRQYLRFDSTKTKRHGQHDRFRLNKDDVGRWTRVEKKIDIPQDATKVITGVIANVIEKPDEDYKNPVYVDNLTVRFSQ